MNVRRTKQELEATARWFEMAYLPRTASAIRALVGTDLRTTTDWHGPIVETYRSEIESCLNVLGEPDPEYHQALIEALDGLLATATGQMDRLVDLMLRSRNALDRVGESHGNTRELYKSFVTSDVTAKHTYLNVCLMYLILSEGVFGPQTRFLLAVRGLGEGHAEPQAILTERVKPSVLVERLNRSGLGVFADGYHRHVRNSIAHGHFKFEGESESMRFRDYKPDSDVVVFDESWPFLRMSKLLAKLDDTYLVNSSYWQVHFLPVIARLDDPTTVQ